MRFGSLVLWDIRFQMKYGFYLLYGILTVLYLLVLSAMPEAWRGTAAAITIFSDPAAMGLFFMGAVVLLEKSQRVPCALAVSPVRAMEYIGAKVLSLCAVSLLVAAVLALGTGVGLWTALLGTALSGAVFTLLGLILATKITSLNQFILWTVPVELAGFVPALLHLFGVSPAVLRLYPANVCIDLIAGRGTPALGVPVVLAVIGILLVIARSCVAAMWERAGGVKL